MATGLKRPLTAAIVVVLAVVVAAALWQRGRAAPSGEFVRTLAIERDADNALRGSVVVATTEPAAVSVEVRSPDGDGFRVEDTATATATDHEIPLLGLRPDEDYEVSVSVVPGSGGDAVVASAGTLTTGPLPDEFPPLSVDASNPEADDLTLFEPSRLPPITERGGPEHNSYLVAVDGSGAVVWYEPMQQGVEDVRQLEDGDLLFTYNETGARRISALGELVGEWGGTTVFDIATEDPIGRSVLSEDALRVDTDQMHHEIVELDNGNLLTLGREMRTVAYPEAICEDEPFDGSYDVVGDTVVEFDPHSGEVVREFSLFDVLDPVDNVPRTVPAEFCGPYLQPRYPDRWPVRDWTHANAVVLDEARNEVLISVRHTDQVVALRYEDDEQGPAGELLWRLGEGGDFDLVGDGGWFFHQHAPEIQPDGTLVIYDNGNERPGTTIEDNYSRVVRYRIDREARTAEVVWEHELPASDVRYAPYVGDADVTSDDTVLITHGGLVDPPTDSPLAPGVQRFGRIIEVDEESGAIVFDLRVQNEGTEGGWFIYRAERIESIYPAGFEVTPLD